MVKTVKHKTCKICKREYQPRSTTQSCCGMDCAIEYARRKENKNAEKIAQIARKQHQEALDKLRPRQWYVNQAQKAVNAYIRSRDSGLPCISCGKHKTGYDAGHYLARSTHPELRFDEDNIHAQCYYCNNYSKNAHAAYRGNLINRIGLERVEALEHTHPAAKWSIDDLKSIKAEYVKKLKGLQNSKLSV